MNNFGDDWSDMNWWRYKYRTRAIITRSRFETALDYKPLIFKVRKLSMYYKPLCRR